MNLKKTFSIILFICSSIIFAQEATLQEKYDSLLADYEELLIDYERIIQLSDEEGASREGLLVLQLYEKGQNYDEMVESYETDMASLTQTNEQLSNTITSLEDQIEEYEVGGYETNTAVSNVEVVQNGRSRSHFQFFLTAHKNLTDLESPFLLGVYSSFKFFDTPIAILVGADFFDIETREFPEIHLTLGIGIGANL